MSEIKWQKPEEISLEPMEGDVAIVWLPVRVRFTHSDQIVTDVDEEGTPLDFRSGLVMDQILPLSMIPYTDQKIEMIIGNTRPE